MQPVLNGNCYLVTKVLQCELNTQFVEVDNVNCRFHKLLLIVRNSYLGAGTYGDVTHITCCRTAARKLGTITFIKLIIINFRSADPRGGAV
jgi:hypothetical protein